MAVNGNLILLLALQAKGPAGQILDARIANVVQLLGDVNAYNALLAVAA